MNYPAYIPEDRDNSNHPLAVDYDISADKEEALDALRGNPLAVGLAKVLKVAMSVKAPAFPSSAENLFAYSELFDQIKPLSERLDDLATVAAGNAGLDRSNLPEIGKLVDMLGGGL